MKFVSKTLPPLIGVAIIILIWHILSSCGIMPSYMMPGPFKVLKTFCEDFDIMFYHGIATIYEAILGVLIGIIISLVIAILMDSCKWIRNSLYPILVVSQTIPSIAIAPLLLLWFGYGTLPKIILIVVTTFFPITVSLLEGFASADKYSMKLLKSMGAGKFGQFIHVKFPQALGHFFAGLKIAVTYSVIGAVISEWLGGDRGLGVYMTRVRRSFAYDKMFAVIIFIALLSILLMLLVSLLKWLLMPWERNRINEKK